MLMLGGCAKFKTPLVSFALVVPASYTPLCPRAPFLSTAWFGTQPWSTGHGRAQRELERCHITGVSGVRCATLPWWLLLVLACLQPAWPRVLTLTSTIPPHPAAYGGAFVSNIAIRGRGARTPFSRNRDIKSHSRGLRDVVCLTARAL